jgi:hypothetical protein
MYLLRNHLICHVANGFEFAMHEFVFFLLIHML